MQPINYLPQNQTSFLQDFANMYQVGAGIRQIQQQQEQQQLAQKQAEQYKVDLRATMQNPTAEAFGQLALKYPGQREAIISSGKLITDAQQTSAFNDASKIFNALNLGNNDAALKIATLKRDALKNAGRDFSDYDDIIDAINTDPKAAKSAIGLIGASLDPKKWTETFKAAPEIEEAKAKVELTKAQTEKEKKQKLAPSIQEALDYQSLTPEQQNTFKSLQILKKPPAAVTNVNVTNLEKGAQGELAKLLPDLYDQANAAASQLKEIPRYRKAIDFAITGPFAETRLAAAQIGSALGFTGDKAINATRELIQGNAEMALKARSTLSGSGSITDSEQNLLVKARSGDISFTKGELNALFNVFERASKAQYEKSIKLLKSASKQSTTAEMFLENVTALPQPKETKKESVTVGNKIYNRPDDFTDEQWTAYKQSVGAK
jgi:hypothetical protein